MTKKEKQEEPLDQVNETADETGEATVPDGGEETGEIDGSGDSGEEGDIDLLRRNYQEINEKYLRLYSEFDNYRKRTQKEKLELYRTAGEDILTSLLPVLDDFERAFRAMKETDDPDSIREGVELIYQKFNNILTQKGLQPMDSAVGSDFDINIHEAVTRIPAPEPGLKGKVTDVVEKGYQLNDKVIRYARVVVGE